MTFRVALILDPARVPDSFGTRIRDLGAELFITDCRTDDETIAACRAADFVLSEFMGHKFERRVIEGLQNCKFVETMGDGEPRSQRKAPAEMGQRLQKTKPVGRDT